MRTLKKTLALVLVVALVLSISVIGANAFDDVKDTNDYYEAITVLTGMKVIDGMTDKTFEPDGTLTRAQAAKIIAFVKLGPTNAKLVSGATAQKFSDVPTSHWAAGYIEYCANLKIVEGVGDGKFDPEGKLTTAAFTKMLLVAVGMDGTSFSGDSWALNVATSAISSKIYNEKIGVSATTPITRAQACELAFLALGYSKNGDTTIYTVKDASNNVLYSGSDPITALLMKQATSTNTLTASTTSTGSLGDTVFGLTKGTATDSFGRKSVAYTNGKTGTAKVTYGTFAPTAKLSYTAATTYGAIVKALGYTKATQKVSFNVYNNSATATTPAVTGKDITSTDAVGAQGTLVEVYATSTTDVYDLVIVDTYVATLAKGDIHAAVASTGAARYITIDSKNYETDSFAAGDVVLYTVADGAIVNVVKAASVSGNITGTGAGYVRVSGTQMKLAAHNVDAAGALPTIGTTAGYANSTTTYTYYTDTYGNIIHAVAGTTTTANVSYLYLIDTAAKITATSGSDLFTTGNSTATAQAKVIDLATGAVSVKSIAVVKNTAGNWVYADASGAATSTAVVDGTKPQSDVGAYYTYTALSDGSIVLGTKASTTAVTLTKDTAVIASGVYANASTKVTVIAYTTNYASTAVTTYTGIANFPATTLAQNALVVAASGIASSVTIVMPQSVTSSVNYAIYKGVGENSLTDGQYYIFYVKGETASYVMTDTTGFSAAPGDVVGLTLTSGKLANSSAVAAQTAKISGAVVSYVDSTFAVAAAGGTTYVIYFGTGCQIYDAGNSYAAGTIAVGDTISVYGSTALSGSTLKDAAFIVIAA